eukprot:754682-Hanusia_phi.AAC.4
MIARARAPRPAGTSERSESDSGAAGLAGLPRAWRGLCPAAGVTVLLRPESDDHVSIVTRVLGPGRRATAARGRAGH